MSEKTTIVKLHVLDENDNSIGRLVLDMDALIALYQQKTAQINCRLEPDVQSGVHREIREVNPEKGELIGRVGDNIEVYRRSDGTVYYSSSESREA